MTLQKYIIILTRPNIYIQKLLSCHERTTNANHHISEAPSQGLPALLIFSQYSEVVGQRSDGIYRLPVTGEIIIHHVYIEEIFPFSSYDGKRLYFREIDAVERQDGEHMAQTALLMRQCEDNTCLVGLLNRPQRIGKPWIGCDKKPCEIMLIVLDRVFKYLHPIQRSRIGVRDEAQQPALIIQNAADLQVAFL